MAAFDKLIEVAELADLLDTGNCRAVDCRFNLMAPDEGREQYLAGHIPGAVYADLDKDLAGPVDVSSGRHPLPEVAVFRSTLENFGIGADTQVVAYDQSSGALASRLWWMLKWVGHRKVAVLNGGIKAWTAAGLPLETDLPDVQPAKLDAAANDAMTATTEEISQSLGQDRFALVDARDAARFDGRSEPIDTVAGHIPGALNLPFSRCVDKDGRWKSAGELRREWQAVLGREAPPEVVVMCGSGVTACHLALAAEVAGMPPPRLYAGSWSEWIRDPARPVAGAGRPADSR
ncbi:MAG: sulfurtransferase [Woeseiaceae bacterium]|nr:sulfurtransferase [Woeseiaceae bacterium]